MPAMKIFRRKCPTKGLWADELIKPIATAQDTTVKNVIFIPIHEHFSFEYSSVFESIIFDPKKLPHNAAKGAGAK